MHLKSLTLRGFKSFASATTFEFEPGVTAVVGPNGSGKSNVVDALAWVMGEQGAKTLRGGKMEDVIFAGTAGRPPLGRAQVSLTIDNSDGALPIDYTEVTISRTLFRTGGSEYAINGEGCRLLDIQELLSDSGLGREMHVIVGQGQLDRVLHATAEDRRGFIEEAAGVLKHRRRKEKTLRKLEAMQANVTRLEDLVAEIRRQLAPLGRQAEVARRAQTVQFEVRDARARLMADDLVQLQDSLAQDVADETSLKERRAEVEQALELRRRRQAELEQEATAASSRLGAIRETWYSISSQRERLRSLASLAAERHRLLGAPAASDDLGSGREPERLEQQAAQLRVEQQQLRHEVQERTEALARAVESKTSVEAAVSAEEQRLTLILRASADRRESLARIAGQVGSARSRAEAAEAELGRLRQAQQEAQQRRQDAQEEFTSLEAQIAGVEAGEESLDADFETINNELGQLEAEHTQLTEQRQQAERERESLTARRDALRVGLEHRNGSDRLFSSGNQGVLRTLAEALTVQSGHEAAIAAALGSAADAVLMADFDAAASAVDWARQDDAGRLEILLAVPVQPEHGASGEVSEQAARRVAEQIPSALAAVDAVTVDPELVWLVRRLLGQTVLVPGFAEATIAIDADPEITAVTAQADVFTRYSVRGGSTSAPSQLELLAVIEETESRINELTAQAERANFQLSGLTGRLEQARADADTALQRLNESDARMASVAERLGTLGSTLRSAVAESERHERAIDAAASSLTAERQALAAASERLTAAQDAPEEAEPATDLRDELMTAAAAARASEMDARLALRSGEEQLSALDSRASSLERAAQNERKARAQAAQRVRARQVQAKKAAAVARAAGSALQYADVSVERAGRSRDEAEERQTAQEAELAELRTGNEALAAELAQLTDSVHRDELARAQQRLRIEALENRAIEELGFTAEHLLAEYGPQVLIPSGPRQGGNMQDGDKWAQLRVEVDADGQPLRAEGVPFVRAEQEKRLRRAERDLSTLGKVNPLALEEFAALEERHQFLASQLEDLRSSRKDLLDIIREVDQRVEQVFTEAFADTAQQFERVFGRLFPGGEGRLVLTDPSDMLTTGIEVEARPAGKKIKRLSLLSGGERSLTAVALLVAIFKARPSPFYVMDEVEAALDDTNLGRLLTIFEELRESSQLIVITHQKRTMDVADALYGVSMRGDGVSAVIGQRISAEA
ncbi:chromosome segregation protein SMC [Acaricomes phytoseiuli]|uniref:chromosome segregation protein SMC n=1 Tax=Acaricomes phytoseiuli TaxID=291968 RepID=UPI0003746098|nr:chromosome segregation protein SMC [Acaricomes phytoseiuli]MCW1249611.1 chromosome segregation protein SMC [Acaricomes phytoseiuli]